MIFSSDPNAIVDAEAVLAGESLLAAEAFKLFRWVDEARFAIHAFAWLEGAAGEATNCLRREE